MPAQTVTQLVPHRVKVKTVTHRGKRAVKVTEARGFIGIVFRLRDDRLEYIYLRPTNGRADDQVRRNRTLGWLRLVATEGND